MKGTRIAGVVIGTVLVVVALGLAVASAVLVAALSQGDDGGYLEADLAALETSTAAITTDDIDLGVDPGPLEWVRDEVSVRLRVTGTGGAPVFVGIGPADAVAEYLDDVAHDEIVEVDGVDARYRRIDGQEAPAEPAAQDFWSARAAGARTQEVTWSPEPGRWVVVVMNADGSAGVAVDASVAGRLEFLGPLTVIVVVLTVVASVAGCVLLWLSLRHRGSDRPPTGHVPPPPGSQPPPPPPAPAPGSWQPAAPARPGSWQPAAPAPPAPPPPPPSGPWQQGPPPPVAGPAGQPQASSGSA